ncbi:hypothetical protein UNDYM_4233 [Undibacterium sp. YM2]|nr:hypothetical protein UNDYM_4233 [Undibacterium sp. YM2]
MNELQHLLDIILAHGMTGRIIPGPPPQIIGGHTMSVHAGITIYAMSFQVSRNDQGWIALTNGEGQHVIETQVSTEEEILALLTST